MASNRGSRRLVETNAWHIIVMRGGLMLIWDQAHGKPYAIWDEL